MKTISVKLDLQTHQWLERQSRQLGRSKAAIACEALEEFRRNATAENAMAELFHSNRRQKIKSR